MRSGVAFFEKDSLNLSFFAYRSEPVAEAQKAKSGAFNVMKGSATQAYNGSSKVNPKE